jgi:hypothetical protein
MKLHLPQAIHPILCQIAKLSKGPTRKLQREETLDRQLLGKDISVAF